MTRLDGWKTLYKDLYTVDIVAYRIALNLGLRSGKPSLAFLHNTNHEDRAYTPLGVCSAEEFVASARVELRSHRDAIARELSEETVDRVVELTDKMGVDDTIEFLKSLLAVSTHLGPLEDSRAVSQSHLRWRIRRLRYNLADRITKICPRWERLEDPIDKQLPPGRSLKAFVGE
jgi:hypothetical protein